VSRGKGKDETGIKHDKNDPNYDSEEEEGYVIEEVSTGPEEATVADAPALLKEYFSSGEKADLAKSLTDTRTNATHNNFVKKALIAGIENGPYERELVSQLLLYVLEQKVVTREKIIEGCEDAIMALDDIVLDNPNATEILGKFLARAIVDEIVPPAFLHKFTKGKNRRVDDCISLSEALVTEKHRIDRLAHIWGPGDLSSVKRLKNEVNELINEFLVSGDQDEAESNVRKLNASSFHFQIVKAAIYLALQQTQAKRNELEQLLKHFHQIGLISSQAISQGFRVCYERINDIELDVPKAKQFIDEIANSARKQGWLQDKQ